MALAELDPITIKARPGSRITDAHARAVAPVLFELEARDGLVKPEAVVEEARDPASPLHPFFDWDDASAAHQQRLAQARTLLRAVVYRVQSIGKGVNDFTAALVRVGGEVVEDGETSPQGYASVTRVLSDEKLRERFVAQAAKDLEAWVRRYETVAALAKAVTTAKDLIAQIKAA